MSGIVAKIQYSWLAHRDLEGIGDYIAEDLKSPVAALNTVNRIHDAIDRLADFRRAALCCLHTTKLPEIIVFWSAAVISHFIAWQTTQYLLTASSMAGGNI